MEYRKIEPPLQKTVGGLLKNRHRVTIEPINSGPGNTPKIFKTKNWNGYSYPIFIEALFTVAKMWNQHKRTTDEWISTV